MFTEKAQKIIDLAKDYANSNDKQRLDVTSVLAAIGNDPEAIVRLADCLSGGDVEALHTKCPQIGALRASTGKVDLEESLREIIVTAKFLASGEGVPDDVHPGLIDLRHLVCALATSPEACRILGASAPMSRPDAIDRLTGWYNKGALAFSIGDLVSNLRNLRKELLQKVFGQDHAIHAFVEGLYNAEVTSAADQERKKPTAVFVFAGPPGVGKTYLSELCASFLGRPFRRFDMTGYTDHQAHNQLVGFAPSYRGAQPGLLTGFVEKNPNAILLFDEIEKAHLTTVQLFYQLLDAGRLEDKFSEKEVGFKDTLIIFTTNAGRSLYDNPNKVGISAANANYHKRTILSALANETNPANGQPAFPPPICSRLAQGYPLMFNHLGINELERVCSAELQRTRSLLQRQYYKQIDYDPKLPILLVFREGGHVDARQLKSETEKFVKGELFKFSSLYSQNKIEDAFMDINKIQFEVDTDKNGINPELSSLFESLGNPQVLLIANNRLAKLYQENVKEIRLFTSASPPEITQILATEDIDMVLLDIWVRNETPASESDTARPEALPDTDEFRTINQDLDYVPFEARALATGRKILRRIHERFPTTPVYLLSLANIDPWCIGSADAAPSFTLRIDAMRDERKNLSIGKPHRKPVDDELFLSCVRAGGARGILATGFVNDVNPNWETQRDLFLQLLTEISRQVYREKKARSLTRERKILSFETVSQVNKEQQTLRIKLRNFSLNRVIDAHDAGEMVEDIDRPNTRFEDVLGANSAKNSLKFVIDWLKNPKRYAAMGIRPPKGLLMTGSPGTGKTMLARAVAGESNCAFIEKSASSFVTIWQGSGPQNVRDLFARARRYAPAVVFIDEIDAIGIKRGGTGGAGRAQEEALNALLTEMDGFSAGSLAPVIVLAATNLAEQLDEALNRRFDRTVEVERPDRAARREYLQRAAVEHKASQVTAKTISRLAGQAAGMTIADLERIVHEAAVIAAQGGSALSDIELEEAFEKFRMGEAKGTIDQSALERVARHEAGHTLVAWFHGNPPVQVTIVGRGAAGGFMERELDEDKLVLTKPEIEHGICESMGGRAAELVYYGGEEGLSTGVAGDLSNATAQAFDMVTKYGMAEEMGLVALPGLFNYQRFLDGPLAEKIKDGTHRIVKEQLNRAVAILHANRESLDKLSAKLLSKNRLTHEELESILPSASNMKAPDGI